MGRFFLDLRELNSYPRDGSVLANEAPPAGLSFLTTVQRAFGAMTEELGNSFLTRPPLDETRTFEDGETDLQFEDRHSAAYAPPSPSRVTIGSSRYMGQNTE
ncbi:hypothetical protein K439DRAFT_1636726 [Ramaria rubella]|nr:hypothetical protein K439DRAFT_1636726 [Ramaria rubella]